MAALCATEYRRYPHLLTLETEPKDIQTDACDWDDHLRSMSAACEFRISKSPYRTPTASAAFRAPKRIAPPIYLDRLHTGPARRQPFASPSSQIKPCLSRQGGFCSHLTFRSCNEWRLHHGPLAERSLRFATAWTVPFLLKTRRANDTARLTHSVQPRSPDARSKLLMARNYHAATDEGTPRARDKQNTMESRR